MHFFNQLNEPPQDHYINQLLIMKPAYERNFLQQINTIEEGLNFLVPKAWWKNFEESNLHIKCYREMKLNESYPLDNLFEADIIEHPLKNYQKLFASLQKDTDIALKSIKKQLKNAESIEDLEAVGKRQKIPCEWLWENSAERGQSNFFSTTKPELHQNPTDCDLLLLSPEIKADMADLFQLRSEDWQVVSPQLYRLIWSLQVKDKRIQWNKTMIAIPVLISKDHALYFDRTIDYRNRKFVEIFLKNCSGYNFCFVGFIDGSVKFKNLLKWIDQGMHRLIEEPKHCKNFRIDNKNMVLALNKKHQLFAYSFYDDVYNEKLAWARFQILEEDLISTSELQKIIVFIGSSKEEEQNNQQVETSVLLRQGRKGRPLHYHRSNEGGRTSIRAEVRPIILKGENGVNFPRAGQVQIIDVHSSTQEQTPSNLQQRDVEIISQSAYYDALSRIPFPIWKESLSPQNLVKLGHIRMTIPKIFKPNGDQSAIIVKDQGKKTALPKQCNQLFKTEDGEIKEKPYVQPEVDEEINPPSSAMKRQLQFLALEILGIRISEGAEQAQKIEEDWAKEPSEGEDITCKNDFMDEFDQEESRQF